MSVESIERDSTVEKTAGESADIYSDIDPANFNNQIVAINGMRRMTELDCRYGKFWNRELIMSDGTRYENVIGIPNENKNNGKAAIWTPAWWTSHKAGYNTEIAIDAMEQGYTAFIQSAELNRGISLAQSAHNMHMAFAESSNLIEYSTDRAVLLGDSRGAMIGFGFLAQAKQKQIEVIGGLLVDPCCAKKVDFSLRPKKLAKLLFYYEHVLELKSLNRQIGRLSSGQFLQYLKTVELSSDFAAQQRRVGPPLFTGEAGELAEQVPDDQPIDVVFFNRSPINHAEEYGKIFELKAANLISRIGTHLSIANPKTREIRIQKLEELREA